MGGGSGASGISRRGRGGESESESKSDGGESRICYVFTDTFWVDIQTF